MPEENNIASYSLFNSELTEEPSDGIVASISLSISPHSLSLIQAAKQAFNHSFLSVFITAGSLLILTAVGIAVFGKEKHL
ncbi:hypothetical protein FE394_05705 [Xenorhabdus sp. Reich]|uniref:MFS transporter n=1 Tax=Xenorhabdus littoralis TaxID=2582835 RepID=A0ABU4SJ70_9GAMM|nr:hypothetical protein [Xenorhabdus sp. Reich]MDX7998698.1 hypothetical protein [Xenorhabdus sp. Reich]